MDRFDLRKTAGRCAVAVTALLVSTSCGGSDTGAEPSVTSESSVVEFDGGFDADRLFETLTASYVAGADLWPGFDPNDFPTILVANDSSGTLAGIFALNYPDPDSLGEARELDIGDGITSAHLITNLEDGALTSLGAVTSMSFDVDVEAVTTFVVLIDPPGSGGLFDAENPPEFSATLLHEMFHIYQSERFVEREGAQDIGGYAYTAENIALALLEDRALAAALVAGSPEGREAAARHLAAIRLIRLDLDPRVILDEDQEIVEGTARDYESRIAQTDPAFTFRTDNYLDNLRTHPDQIIGPLKWHFGFDRFYSTGAAQIELLRLLEVDGIEERVQAGESPMDIVIAELGVTADEAPGLLDEARALYDPDAELDAAAEQAAIQAADEPDPLSDDSIAEYIDAGSLEDQLRSTFGDEAYDCLEEAGADFESEEPPAESILTGCGVDLNELGG